MGNGCSKQKNNKHGAGITTNYDNPALRGASGRSGDDPENDMTDDEEDDDEEPEDNLMADAGKRLNEWFKTFMQETEADRRSVQTWARLCIWRYFWDYLFEVVYNGPLEDTDVWGRPLPSISQRHANIKTIAEHTLKKMEKKHRDRVFAQLCAFSDLQGPDIYWNEELRTTGLEGLSVDESESLDDIRALTNFFGVLTINFFTEPTLPIFGKWVSANYTGDIDDMNDENQESSDFVVLTLTKDGWEDLKLLTMVNNHPRVKKFRAARQKIRMLHGCTVRVLMKNCLRCAAPMVEGASECVVYGMLEFNEHSLKKLPHQILDYDPSFKFRLRNISTNKIERCGPGCHGNIPTALAELDPDQFFIGSLLARNSVPPSVAALWEAALRRRRTCGLSMHFFANIYANKDMPKQPHEVCKIAFEKCEGSHSMLYQELFENTRPTVSKAVVELYRRMDNVAMYPDRSYWFKFWVTVCKALYPNSSSVPDTLWDFDFVNNHKAVCYRIIERDELEDILSRNEVFDNSQLYFSKNHSVDRILDHLYRNIAAIRQAAPNGAYSAALATETKGDGEEGEGTGESDAAAAAGAFDMSMMNGMPPMMQMMMPMMFAMLASNGGAGAHNAGGPNPMVMAVLPMLEASRSQAAAAVAAAQPNTPAAEQAAAQMNAINAVFTQLGLNTDGASGTAAGQFLAQQQSALTPLPQNSEEFDRTAAESQECMAQLLAIQTDVASGTMSRETARDRMAELALKYPVLFNAIGGQQGVEAVATGRNVVAAPGTQTQQVLYVAGPPGGASSGSTTEDSETDDEEGKPRRKSKKSRKHKKKSKKSRRRTDEDEDEDEASNSGSDSSDDEEEGKKGKKDKKSTDEDEGDENTDPTKMKMKKGGGPYQRTCGTITDNGVKEAEEPEPEETDGCTIA